MIFSLITLLSYLALLYAIGVKFLCNLNRKPKTIAFFHPYCNGGGGGERVLWRTIATVKEKGRLFIYTTDYGTAPTEIIANARKRFDISIDSETIEFVYLRLNCLIVPKPCLTLYFQMFGGLWLGIEALWRLTPEVFIDTMGCPLTLPLFSYIGGCKVGTYVHYPTITNEMIDLVGSGKSTYNNSDRIANMPFLTKAKIFYYRDLINLYKFCGSSTDFVMTNGSWTNSHISVLWKKSLQDISIVYPPCNVEELFKTENNSEKMFTAKNRVQILSVSQIRPEKNHELQLQIFAEVRRLAKEENLNCQLVLIIAGGCRNEEDLIRLEGLKKMVADSFELENLDDVQWKINISYTELKELLQNSMIGLHTMWNEHFGISVVEGLAAGLIMVAHDSAGPKLDIIKDDRDENKEICGFLAESKEDYARKIIDIIKMGKEQREIIRKNAIKSAQKFSNAEFDRRISAICLPYLA